MEEYLKRLRVLAGINESVIKEAPITDFGTVGDFDKPESIREPVDLKSVTKERLVKKIKQKWENTPFNFNLYFVNKPGYEKFIIDGQIDRKIFKYDFPELVDRISDNAINVIFTNNIGARRIRLTPWIIAHRFSHAIAEGNLLAIGYWEVINIIENLNYNFLSSVNVKKLISQPDPFSYNALKTLYYHIGTMNSARKKMLSNNREFVHEVFTQYLLTGKVRFNLLNQEYLDRVLPIYKLDISHPEVQKFNQYLENLSKELPDRYEKILSRIVGKIFLV